MTMQWCSLGKHDVPLDGFAKNQRSCRVCRQRYRLNNYTLGKVCPDCGTKISNKARRCAPCNGLSKRGVPHGSGRSKHPQGYIILSGQYDHPNASSRGLLAEHVKVMTEMLGRPMRPGENVHHRNGIRDDNRPENLEIWISSQPPGQRVVDLVAWARDIIDTYGDEVPA